MHGLYIRTNSSVKLNAFVYLFSSKNSTGKIWTGLVQNIVLSFSRCIVIHECEEAVFHMFLHYLYGGTLDTTTMTLNDIIELLAVADRYETTSLRTMCEGLLVDRVEDGSVFALLQVADHYSARRLRVNTDVS